MKFHLFLTGFTLLTLVISCISSPDFNIENETKKILKLHHDQRDYHFNKDSLAFTDQLSNQFISVNRGIISHPTKGETLNLYNNYFSSVEFLEWDDISEPIIRFSNDGSMAYTIVEKIVKLRPIGGGENADINTTHFAWTSIYKKYGNEWKIDLVTSTNK